VNCDEVPRLEGLLYPILLLLLLVPLPLLSSPLFHISKYLLCLIQRRTVTIWIDKNMVRFCFFLFCRVCTSVPPWLWVLTRLLLLMLILSREWEDVYAVKPLFNKHKKVAGKPLFNSSQVINSNIQNHTLNSNYLILFITVLYYFDSGL